jgi:hypothetical protein
MDWIEIQSCRRMKSGLRWMQSPDEIGFALDGIERQRGR